MFRQVVVVLLALVLVVSPATVIAGGPTHFTGDGTSYTLSQVSSGNCNFMYDPGVGENYAALNHNQWDATHNCGRCANVTCDDGRCRDSSTSAIVYLVDRCPECAHGDLDLSPTVFKQITGSDPSRYKIKWHFVECPVRGNIQYCTKSGSSNSWLAVQPTNFAHGVASMKIANQDVTMVDSCFYFLLNGGANVDISAVDIELTSVTGETITEKLSLSSDDCTAGTANFGTSSTQTASTPTTAAIQSSLTPAPMIRTAPLPTTKTTPAPAMSPLPAPVKAAALIPPTTSSKSSMALPGKPTSTITPSSMYTFTGDSQGQAMTQQTQPSEVTEAFDPLNMNSSSSKTGTSYKAGAVVAANELGGKVAILQSTDTGVEKASSVQQQKELSSPKQTDPSDIEQVTTKSKDSSSSTSTVVVGLIVLAVVGGIALASVVYVVKKKALHDKRIDRDMAMMRSFDTFSSPVRMDATIAKI